jgi:Dyp-type peroxidase family
MLNDVTSRHLRNANDLLVLAPIKQGFVPVSETMSYATRLRILLRSFYEGNRLLAESKAASSPGPTERLETILNTQYTVLPDNRYLLVTVTFDRNWEEYFRFLVLHSGASLDAIFMHCEGYADYACRRYDGHSVTLQYQAFSEFIRRNQVRTDFYFAAFPDLTSDDIVYLRKLATERAPSANKSASVVIKQATDEITDMQIATALAKAPPGTSKSVIEKNLRTLRVMEGRRALAGLLDLRKSFPDVVEPDGKSKSTLAKASDYFDEAVINIVTELDDVTSASTADPLDKWIVELQERKRSTRIATETSPELDPANVQANILERFRGKMLSACAVMLRWEDRGVACQFIKYITEEITWQAGCHDHGRLLNFFVTYPGLKRLGLPDDVLRRFPKDFRDGMEARSGAIGDVGEPNHPDYWHLPLANWADGELAENATQKISIAAVDCVIVLQREEKWNATQWKSSPLSAALTALEKNTGARILHVQHLQRDDSNSEHFGFPDGSSQPVPDILPFSKEASRDHQVPLGEFLLGYADARGEIARCARQTPDDPSYKLFKDGSFLVMRKLDQDVPAFNEFVRVRAKKLETCPDVVKGWIMGRTPGGAPLVQPTCSGNSFNYDNDADGEKCPLHAHIRRANPRKPNAAGGALPRIVRRGFSYGTRLQENNGGAGEERGLLFMAYNASIAQQFEVVQRWLNGGNSTGILSAQNDLLTGAPRPASAPHWALHPTRRQWVDITSPVTPFVSLRWGLYLFAPAKSGLEWLKNELSAPAAIQDDPELILEGKAVIARLQAIEAQQGAEAARVAWKSVIEEFFNEPASTALWAAIRAEPRGLLMTPYGLLVAKEDGAREVLAGDGRNFSVREYWHRLLATTGEHYLSFDPAPHALRQEAPQNQVEHEKYEERVTAGTYAATAGLPNRHIEKAFNGNAADIFKTTFDAAQVVRDHWNSSEIHVEEFATVVVAKLSHHWFDLPVVAADDLTTYRRCDKEPLHNAIAPFVLASRFSFQPYPEPTVTKQAMGAGSDSRNRRNDQSRCNFFKELSKEKYDPENTGRFDADAATRAIRGAIVGFAAPAIGAVTVVMNRLLEDNELGRVLTSISAYRGSPSAKQLTDVLREPILQALYRTPVPPLLYRTAMHDATVAGTQIEPGTLVIVGLGSVRRDSSQNAGGADDAWHWLFGGERREQDKSSNASGVNPHGCPARNAALAVIAAITAALLVKPGVERVRPFVISYRS